MIGQDVVTITVTCGYINLSLNLVRSHQMLLPLSCLFLTSCNQFPPTHW